MEWTLFRSVLWTDVRSEAPRHGEAPGPPYYCIDVKRHGIKDTGIRLIWVDADARVVRVQWDDGSTEDYPDPIDPTNNFPQLLVDDLIVGRGKIPIAQSPPMTINLDIPHFMPLTWPYNFPYVFSSRQDLEERSQSSAQPEGYELALHVWDALEKLAKELNPGRTVNVTTLYISALTWYHGKYGPVGIQFQFYHTYHREWWELRPAVDLFYKIHNREYYVEYYVNPEILKKFDCVFSRLKESSCAVEFEHVTRMPQSAQKALDQYLQRLFWKKRRGRLP